MRRAFITSQCEFCKEYMNCANGLKIHRTRWCKAPAAKAFRVLHKRELESMGTAKRENVKRRKREGGGGSGGGASGSKPRASRANASASASASASAVVHSDVGSGSAKLAQPPSLADAEQQQSPVSATDGAVSLGWFTC